ncbi:hypothetical protein GPJ56_009429 [Histomonas meleagridis]|uniref:uncharacterized protein n=1 Tax=Histomonas meleagridis TaxID=135588 RepID=UPI00355A66DF|nr:hypothetical protein GPJ56_009429 [Histomonas meleagridis]KAH0797467.1 hypothetical protein GO595_009788 [Histomonas meleagridis]
MEAENLQTLIRKENINVCFEKIIELTKDHDNLLQILELIAIQISDDKPEFRGKYLTLMSSIIEQHVNELDASELRERFQNCLPQVGHHVVKRVRRLTYALCLLCISKSGLLKDDTQLAIEFINEILSIGENNKCFRTLCYQTAIDIVLQFFPTDYKQVLNIFKNQKEDAPSSADRLYLWLVLSRHYPKIKLNKEFQINLSPKSFEKFQPILSETVTNSVSIHPLLCLLSENHSSDLISLSSSLYMEDQFNHPIMSALIASSIPYLDSNEFITFLKNRKLFNSSISIPHNAWLVQSIKRKLTAMINNSDPLMHKVLNIILTYPRDHLHKFLFNYIRNCFTLFNDEQTLEIINETKELSFNVAYKLLSAQIHRERINNFGIIKEILQKATSKVSNEKDRIKLSEFINNIMRRTTNDGKPLLTESLGIEMPIIKETNSRKEISQISNEVISMINSINNIIGINENFDVIKPNKTSFIEFVSKLIKSSYPHYKNIGIELLKCGIFALSSSSVNIISDIPELLQIAIKREDLCKYVIPYYIQKINEIPTSDDMFTFPLTQEDSYEVIPIVMNEFKGEIKNESQIKIIESLFSLLNEEQIIEVIIQQIDKIVSDENNAIGGTYIILMKIKQSFNLANSVMKYILEIVPKYITKQSAMKNLRLWMAECVKYDEIDVNDIENAVFTLVNVEYQTSASGKKKAEAAMSWALKTLKATERKIPCEMFEKLGDVIEKTGSRAAASMLKNIINMNKEN